MNRHLVLVGLPGSGKTTAGRLAAEQIGAAFSDLDEIIVMTTGVPVAEFFASHGEARFRQLERAAMDGALAAPPHLIAPGAGWMAEPGNLEAAAGAQLVYLEITPALAAARLAGDNSRPLLAGADPVRRMEELLRRREPFYRCAAVRVDASGPAEQVAREIVRQAGGGARQANR